MRRQGKDDTNEYFRVRSHHVGRALCLMKDSNPTYHDVVTDGASIKHLLEDDKLPNLRNVEFSETEHIDDQGPPQKP